MSSVALSGNAAGSGTLTIAAPNTNSNRTLTLPDNTGTFITTASTGQIIPKAALPTGSVLQVVSANTTSSTATTSTSFVTTSLSASITPTSSTSKIFVLVSGGVVRPSSTNQSYLTIYRGGTNLGSATRGLYQVGGVGLTDYPVSLSYYDSPATTSSTTYTLYVTTSGSTTTFEIDAVPSTMIIMEIAA